jgi:FkbM family methyltransferase
MGLFKDRGDAPFRCVLDGLEIELPAALAPAELRRKLTSGEYEGAEARAARARIREGQRVLDLGAGLGFVTMLAARAAGPANVLAVEANPELIPAIRANLERNGLGAVDLRHGAVVPGRADADPAPVRLRTGAAFTSSSVGPGGGVEVPAIPLARLLREHRPHVVTMDVEGMEARLFADHMPWPACLRLLVLELHPKRYDAHAIKRIVDAMSARNMTYDPLTSAGRVLGLRRVWGEGEVEPEGD